MKLGKCLFLGAQSAQRQRLLWSIVNTRLPTAEKSSSMETVGQKQLLCCRRLHSSMVSYQWLDDSTLLALPERCHRYSVLNSP